MIFVQQDVGQQLHDLEVVDSKRVAVFVWAESIYLVATLMVGKIGCNKRCSNFFRRFEPEISWKVLGVRAGDSNSGSLFQLLCIF